jgi:glyoxylase-like metal-dependent hydrolase (beta-lactamase superfamily II)
MTLDGTNSWLLDTGHGVVVVDPGPRDEAHLRRLAGPRPVRLVLLTHGHPDHAEGVDRLAELTAAPVRAQDPSLCRDGAPLVDGEPIDAGALVVRVLATPGHSGDSVSFVVESERHPAVLTGDTVLGTGTTVVAHPDGRLADYLTTLHRLRALAATHAGLVLLTGHGPVPDDALATLDYYVRHRAERLAKVEAAVAAGAETPQDVLRVVYADVDRALWPAAELSVRAQLVYLRDRRSGKRS